STISGNTSMGDAHGGGIASYGNVAITYSTVSGNTGFEGGGIKVSGGSLVLANSTVSGNYGFAAGGVYIVEGNVTIQNSTIAFNTASTGKNGTDYMAPGLAVETFTHDLTVSLKSSILAQNTYGTTENDLSKQPFNKHVITINGADNLI